MFLDSLRVPPTSWQLASWKIPSVKLPAVCLEVRVLAISKFFQAVLEITVPVMLLATLSNLASIVALVDISPIVRAASPQSNMPSFLFALLVTPSHCSVLKEPCIGPEPLRDARFFQSGTREQKRRQRTQQLQTSWTSLAYSEHRIRKWSQVPYT